MECCCHCNLELRDQNRSYFAFPAAPPDKEMILKSFLCCCSGKLKKHVVRVVPTCLRDVQVCTVLLPACTEGI